MEALSDRKSPFTTFKPGTKLAESDSRPVRLEASPPFSPKENTKRIPEGTILGAVPLEAAKAYPVRIWEQAQRNFGLEPRIAYADFNTHQERNILSVKLLPDGGKTAPHPQIVLFVNGPYHVETLGYNVSNPFDWTTWMEVHIDARQLKQLIDSVIKAELAVEALA